MSQEKIPRATDYFGGIQKVQESINQTVRSILLDRLGRNGSSAVYALAERRTKVNGLGMFLIGENRQWNTTDMRKVINEMGLSFSLNDLLPVFEFKESDRAYWLQLMQEKGFNPKNPIEEQEDLEAFIYATACDEISASTREPK